MKQPAAPPAPRPGVLIEGAAPEPCARCGAEIDMAKARWLELDKRSGRYSDPAVSPLPDERSQGLFPFGLACARAELKGASR